MWNVCLCLSELTAIEKANAPTSVRTQHGGGILQGVPALEPSTFQVSDEFSLWHTHTHTHTHTHLLLFWCGRICLNSLLNSSQSIKVIRICLPPVISLYENVIYLERRCQDNSCSKWINESETTRICILNHSLDKLNKVELNRSEMVMCDWG